MSVKTDKTREEPTCVIAGYLVRVRSPTMLDRIRAMMLAGLWNEQQTDPVRGKDAESLLQSVALLCWVCEIDASTMPPDRCNLKIEEVINAEEHEVLAVIDLMRKAQQ